MLLTGKYTAKPTNIKNKVALSFQAATRNTPSAGTSLLTGPIMLPPITLRSKKKYLPTLMAKGSGFLSTVSYFSKTTVYLTAGETSMVASAS